MLRQATRRAGLTENPPDSARENGSPDTSVTQPEYRPTSIVDHTRFWVIPPDLLGHGAVEREGRDHPFEDGLGALERQRDHERGVGVGPGGDEEGDEPAAVGEVDVDVAEIRLEALAREMAQGDERLLPPPPVLEHIALHLGVPAGVAVFVAEAAKDLGGGVPLLGR